VDFPHLWAYARDLYQIPAFDENTLFDHIKAHYHVCCDPGNTFGIIPMVADDLDVAVSLLTASFQDRPFYTYIASDPDECRSFLIANFHRRITQGLGVNEIDLAVSDDELAGIAVWSPPAAYKADTASLVAEERSLEEWLMAYSARLQERFRGL
jgi:hypothetical protein